MYILTFKLKKLIGVTCCTMIIIGCGSPTPEYENGVCQKVPEEKVYIDVNKGIKTIETYKIYTPDVILKEATAILIHKVKTLESKVRTLESKQKIVVAQQKRSELSEVASKNTTRDTLLINRTDFPLEKKSLNDPGVYSVSFNNAYIYQYATHKSPILKKLEKGSEVFLGKCNKFGWCSINGTDGYIQIWKLKKQGEKR